MISPILAESDISPQIILAVLFVVFGGIKWIWENFVKKEPPSDSSAGIEDLYEQYRSQIVDKQTQVQQPQPQQHTPPPIPAPAQRPQVQKSFNPTPQIPGILPKVEKPKLTEAEKIALERVQNRESGVISRRKRPNSEIAKFRKLLSNPNSVRTAIILQEIMEKPKSLR